MYIGGGGTTRRACERECTLKLGRCQLLKSVSVFGYFFGYFLSRFDFSVSVSEITDIFGYFSVIVKFIGRFVPSQGSSNVY